MNRPFKSCPGKPMIQFSTFDAFKRVSGTEKTYQLEAPLNWDIGKKGSGWSLLITPGTTFDISVPRLFEWALSPHNRRVLPAAAIHDELLRRGHDSAFASSEFRRALIARGYLHWRAWGLFLATLIWMTFKSVKKT